MQNLNSLPVHELELLCDEASLRYSHANRKWELVEKLVKKAINDKAVEFVNLPEDGDNDGAIRRAALHRLKAFMKAGGDIIHEAELEFCKLIKEEADYKHQAFNKEADEEIGEYEKNLMAEIKNAVEHSCVTKEVIALENSDETFVGSKRKTSNTLAGHPKKVKSTQSSSTTPAGKNPIIPWIKANGKVNKVGIAEREINEMDCCWIQIAAQKGRKITSEDNKTILLEQVLVNNGFTPTQVRADRRGYYIVFKANEDDKTKRCTQWLKRVEWQQYKTFTWHVPGQ